ncbi:Oligosaccharyl transferase STT3 subunit family protein [Tritrichomonas foetus]|uniref:dolichyl-diphosphooligosaccharide--protein glycotransferase n=1 Tax=Tritrichomonas foetus TaxID=1144522 RepID=A0A1J4JJP6_9EUKA|nr:Oligosaccharyl transferase STT3 subunit family protein [Tritrichomonas foetus]|eukprot:OHS99384.1 Oligosaccharyl transferase STT3 subunit family protein [Tritrichomonas foetus]
MKFTQLLHSLRFTIVFLSCILAFLIRLFSNLKAEPIIHEFDPHFNWRCTQYIDQHGLYEFLNWFDNISWYPQGRPVGETSYPGMMFTSAIIKWMLQKIQIHIDIIDICIYSGPVFAVLSTLLSFLYGQLIEDSSLGCLFAALASFIPGTISRSMAGSYDYECIALFILVLCLYTFTLALKNGSLFYSMISALAYGYMCLTWGGYVFISNCIPLYTVVLIVLGRYSWRLHITYSIWAVVGTLLSYEIPFIGDKILKKPEHFALLGVFIFIQVWGFFTLLYHQLSQPSYSSLVVCSIMIFPLFVLVFFTIGASTGLLGGFSGRLMQLFNPAYVTKTIPILASVAEHQTSSWPMFFLECGLINLLFPLGCYFILKNGISSANESVFLILIYGLSTLYFAGVMVRLVMVFTPAATFLASIGIQRLLRASFNSKYQKKSKALARTVQITLFILLVQSVLHGVWLAMNSYSGDHIHFPVRSPYGFEDSDDYREGYRWLWTNTGHNERVMSWWDYGYQITSMGGRGCMADGNTNNFTHIGIIGMTMSSPEPISWRLARLMGADYMLVIFGGASGYDGDDINKFLWMPKIAHQTFTNISGDMYLPRYGPLVSPGMSKNMTYSMMFRFCYHNFKRFEFHSSVPSGFDLSRFQQVPNLDIKLTNFEEAFTSKHWIVRIYRVKPDPLWNRVY